MSDKPTYEELEQRVQKLEESERKLVFRSKQLESLMNNNAFGIVSLDKDMRIVGCNEAFEDLFLYAQSEMEGKTLDELIVDGDLLEKANAYTKTTLTGKSTQGLGQRRRKDSVLINVKFSGIPITVHGEVIGAYGIYENITAITQAEEEIRKLSIAVEQSPSVIAITDLSGNLEYVNPKFTELTGYTREEAISSGQTILIHSIAELVYENGLPIKILGVIRDVTEQKKAEKERKHLEDQLQHAQKMEAIGTLAGGVAHDLNNILGGLVSYPELLLLQLPEDSPLRKSILTIQSSGEKAAAVVQDLLTLARRGVVVTEVVKLNNVIAQYLKSPEYEKLQSYHPTVHMETHLEKDTLNILGSSIHLSKTVMNLVSNAAEAMLEGGTLSISTENRYIDRPIGGYNNVKEGDYVVLIISDTGMGISPDDINKIFEPFYTKKKMGRSGTGLGMAVVWGTVKDHNGYIHVQSTEGKGTTFTLYFPVTRKSLEERPETALVPYS